MLKRSKTIGLILLLFLYSCKDEQQRTKDESKEIETSLSQYHKDDVVGVWNVFHVEITEGRYKESYGNTVLYKGNYADDSLVFEFKKDFTFSINGQSKGNWSLKNDSVEIISINNSVFPLNIKSTYKIHRGNFDKNWYLYTSYYNRNGKISHSVRVVAKRGIQK